MAIEAKKGASVAAMGRRARLGMVGGGEGAFIGGVHRMAARLDDHCELVAGALASMPDKAQRSGRALGLADQRSYADCATMANAEILCDKPLATPVKGRVVGARRRLKLP